MICRNDLYEKYIQNLPRPFCIENPIMKKCTFRRTISGDIYLRNSRDKYPSCIVMHNFAAYNLNLSKCEIYKLQISMEDYGIWGIKSVHEIYQKLRSHAFHHFQ